MKRAIFTLRFNLDAGPEFAFTVHDPGNPLGLAVEYVPKPGLITRNPAPLVPQVQLLVECDPTAPERERHYIALPQGRVLETAHALKLVGLVTNPTTNAKVALYEVIDFGGPLIADMARELCTGKASEPEGGVRFVDGESER